MSSAPKADINELLMALEQVLDARNALKDYLGGKRIGSDEAQYRRVEEARKRFESSLDAYIDSRIAGRRADK